MIRKRMEKLVPGGDFDVSKPTDCLTGAASPLTCRPRLMFSTRRVVRCQGDNWFDGKVSNLHFFNCSFIGEPSKETLHPEMETWQL